MRKKKRTKKTKPTRTATAKVFVLYANAVTQLWQANFLQQNFTRPLMVYLIQFNERDLFLSCNLTMSGIYPII